MGWCEHVSLLAEGGEHLGSLTARDAHCGHAVLSQLGPGARAPTARAHLQNWNGELSAQGQAARGQPVACAADSGFCLFGFWGFFCLFVCKILIFSQRQPAETRGSNKDLR